MRARAQNSQVALPTEQIAGLGIQEFLIKVTSLSLE